MGEHSLDPFVEWVERPRRTVQEPLRARSKHVRVQLGFGWCRCRVLLCCRDRFRDRWLRDIAKRGVRTRGNQADGWADRTIGNYSDLALAGHGWPDGTHST